MPARRTARRKERRMPILTAKVGTNADQFPDILAMYVPPPAKILDMTYGKGVFWKNFIEDGSGYWVQRNDIDPDKGDCHYDFRDLPESWTGKFDAAVFDPPYKLTGTIQRPDQYGNKDGGWAKVGENYWQGIGQAYKVLRKEGILIVKCMDQVVSGKQAWLHLHVFDCADYYDMIAEDLFVMMRPNATPQPHETQKHAWKNHSFWWVFRKV